MIINPDELPLHDLLIKCRDYVLGHVSISGRNPTSETYCIRLTPEDLEALIHATGPTTDIQRDGT